MADFVQEHVARPAPTVQALRQVNWVSQLLEAIHQENFPLLISLLPKLAFLTDNIPFHDTTSLCTSSRDLYRNSNTNYKRTFVFQTTLLEFASSLNKINICKLFIEGFVLVENVMYKLPSGMEPIEKNLSQQRRSMALVAAMYNQHFQLAKYLISKGAKNESMLVDAYSRCKDLESLNYFCNLPETKTLDDLDDQQNVFFAAISSGLLEFVNHVAQLIPSILSSDKALNFICAAACAYGTLDIVKFFIEKGADPNATDQYKRKSIYYAVGGSVQVIKMLHEEYKQILEILKFSSIYWKRAPIHLQKQKTRKQSCTLRVKAEIQKL